MQPKDPTTSHQERQLTPEEEQKLEELCQMSFDFARQNDTESLAILLKGGLNPNIANHKGDTLLMLASYYNSLDAAALLLQYKADANKTNDKNLSPLSGVCFKGYTQMAELLLSHGANPDLPNAMGMTPFDFAVMFRRKEIIQILEKYSQQKIGFFKKMWLKL